MKRLWLLFAQTVTLLVAVYFVVATLKPEWMNRRPSLSSAIALIEAPAAPAGTPMPGSYSGAAKRASPAVVSINTSTAARRGPRSDDPWFQFFFGEQGNQPQAGLGSGVIISADGYILTNNHVVEGADDIDVVLNDSRHARAKVIGTDPETDLAILKIDLDKLPVIVLGISDALQVGDNTIANVQELLSSVAALKPGTPATFSLLRRDNALDVQVTPGLRPKPRSNRQQ